MLSDTALRRLLKACEGPDFTERRDTALVLFLLDTSVRPVRRHRHLAAFGLTTEQRK